jgi:hypothetical protein
MWSNDLHTRMKERKRRKRFQKRVDVCAQRKDKGGQRTHLFSSMRTTTCSMRGLVDLPACGFCILFGSSSLLLLLCLAHEVVHGPK